MRMNPDDLQRMNRVLRHQLRNFASGVKNAVALLECELKGRLPPESEEYFPLIKDECMHLFGLTERLGLLFDPDCPARVAARAESGPVAVGELLENVLAEARREFPTAEVCVESGVLALSARAPGGGALPLALREIVRNALETSRTPRVAIDCDLRDGELRLTVRDNGPGLGAVAPAVIFEPFYTTRSKHVGIGLCIAAEVLAGKGGTVSAEAAPGGGLMVTVRIPAPNGEDIQ